MADEPAFETFGQRLQRAAERIIVRYGDRPAWWATAAPVLARMAGRAAPTGNRFDRVEVTLGDPEPALPGSAGSALPPPVLDRLEPLVGPAARAVRVHDGPDADRIARAHRADAVAVGADVHFAAGRYRPAESRGFALLAHEAVHVAHALAPGVGLDRSGSGAVTEERAARAVEGAARLGSVPRPGPAAAAEPGTAAAISAGTTARAPMAAATDRPEPAPLPPPDPPLDVAALRAGLLRELREQLRTDLERGA